LCKWSLDGGRRLSGLFGLGFLPAHHLSAHGPDGSAPQGLDRRQGCPPQGQVPEDRRGPAGDARDHRRRRLAQNASRSDRQQAKVETSSFLIPQRAAGPSPDQPAAAPFRWDH
jgi:hypothetical protein